MICLLFDSSLQQQNCSLNASSLCTFTQETLSPLSLITSKVSLIIPTLKMSKMDDRVSFCSPKWKYLGLTLVQTQTSPKHSKSGRMECVSVYFSVFKNHPGCSWNKFEMYFCWYHVSDGRTELAEKFPSVLSQSFPPFFLPWLLHLTNIH